MPPILRADLAAPVLPRGSWVWTIGPAFAGLFIWVPLLDPAGALVLGDASLGWLIATAGLAAIACHALLYSIPALLGWRSGRRLSLVAASTFGTTGSEWITGVAVGLGALVLQAVSIFVAIELTLLGLVSLRLVAPAAVETWSLGPFSLVSPVFILTALFWIFITGMSSLLRLVAVIGALMKVYTPVAFLLLGAVALHLSRGLAGFESVRVPVLMGAAGTSPAAGAMARLFQLLFASFALSGLMAVDWGQAVQDRRGIRIGGWMAIVLAGSYGVTMALLTVAGALGTVGTGFPPAKGFTLANQPLFHRAIQYGLPGILGGVVLLLFGLACLAPACYAAWISSHRFATHWPRLRRFTWTWIASAGVLVLIVFSWAGQLEEIFSLLGAVFAPAVGAIVGDALRLKGRWTGVRQGWNIAGVLAWATGLAVGLVPLVAELGAREAASWFQPASLYAFVASAGVFLIVSALVTSRPLVALPEVVLEQVETTRVESTASVSQ